VEAEVNPFDRELLVWLNGLSGRFQPFDDLMRVMASDYLMPLVFSVALVGLWFAGRGREKRERYQMSALVGMGAIGLANVAVWLLNISWARPRPFAVLGDELDLLFYPPTDPSFPANAVAVGFAAGSAAWRASPRLGATVCTAAALLGFSRVFAGVFWPTDIIGGAAVGVLVTWGAVWLGRVLEPLPTLAIRLGRALGLA
jgi:undecaprenyl-diphosphatase